MTDADYSGWPRVHTPPHRPWSAQPQEIVPPIEQAPVVVPVAWLGRTSDEDAQDPTLSLPRQLRNARAAMPAGWVIVAHFYDVESGRKDLAARGRGKAHERFNINIPRDGGIADLLTEAESPKRRFAAVICESIERVARRTYFGTKIEYELERNGIALCAADEPITMPGKAKKATPTLTRRVKQAVSEWYVLQMLELSWDGFCEHTRQGWNIGKPPYGYLADKVPHPVPARRAEGRTKHRLVPDPQCGAVVTEIFRLRVVHGLSHRAIANRLDRDHAVYPPPAPIRTDTAVGRWTGSAVRGILENPKYTGYQVWNRRARKKGNKNNPPSEWIWSPQPTHEPLVSREMFDAALPVPGNGRPTRDHGTLHSHPATQRSYLLRSYVRCEICGRRMFGKFSKGREYYCCQPKTREEVEGPGHEPHPTAVWISGKALTDLVHTFFAERIFGPDRHKLLAAELRPPEAHAVAPNQGKEEVLRQAIADNDRRQQALFSQLSDCDFDGDLELAARFRAGVRNSFKELDAAGQKLRAQPAEVVAERAGDDTAQDLDVLRYIPLLRTRLPDVPEDLQRELYDAFRLVVRYDRRCREVTLQATIPARLAGEVAHLVEQVSSMCLADPDGKLAAEADQPEPCSHSAPADQPSCERPRQDSNLRPSA
ncbi:recombinase family protein [Kitasatospora acidiphila]|uniref:recombinase family protein n=1 Tax=Kitasatospora acidiphila TaxID=2567942 RepID=UPI002B4003B7|nr:recombinase family protein [Kitasatospora acidiphila]